MHKIRRERSIVGLIFLGIVTGLVLFLLMFWVAFGASANSRPNVLFIVLDDLNLSPGAYGGQAITPNIDRLAAEGTRFDNAYCQFTLCNPSRASMLSGKRPETIGVLRNEAEPPNVLTFPEHLSNNGYFTAGIGKIAHEGWPNSVKWNHRETATEIGEPVIPSPAVKDKHRVDGRIARRVVKQIKKHRNAPFLIAAGFTLPHAPTIAPQKYLDLYQEEDIITAEIPGNDGMTEQERRIKRKEYYACVSFVDAQIGLILDALDTCELRDNTIIVFTSDHGYLLGEHGIWDKRQLFWPVAQVPLIISAPDKLQGTSLAIVELLDIFPTLVDLTGLPLPSVEGRSLTPLLDNPALLWSSYAYTATIENQRSPVFYSVRDERYSLILHESLAVELYDRIADPNELENRLSDPSYTNQRTRLQDAFQSR
jgi:iduronate 2-sulfatase